VCACIRLLPVSTRKHWGVMVVQIKNGRDVIEPLCKALGIEYTKDIISMNISANEGPVEVEIKRYVENKPKKSIIQGEL